MKSNVKKWAITGASILLITSCLDEELSETVGCVEQIEVDVWTNGGSVVGLDAYSYSAAWFNQSLEDSIFDFIEDEILEEFSLDKNDEADRERIAYLSSGMDLRLLLSESESINQVAVYLYDVNQHEIQPNTKIDIVSMEPYLQADTEADRGNAIRDILDTMQSNGTPDALVVYAPDRTDEPDERRIFINLFAEDNYFAESGYATFSNLKDVNGNDISSVVYPMAFVEALDVSATVVFDNQVESTISTQCLALTISG